MLEVWQITNRLSSDFCGLTCHLKEAVRARVLIVVGSALLIYSIHRPSPRPRVTLEMPISLSPGHITTGYFDVEPDTLYYVDVELGKATTHTPAGCEPSDVLRTHWTVTSEGQPAEKGSSPWEDSGLTLAVFLGENPRYAFDATIFPGASCLNARHPRLTVRTHVPPNDLYSGLSWLSIWFVATGLILLVRLWLWEVFPKQAILRIFPGMALRNVLPLQRHRPMPLMKDLPHFGLVWVCILLIPLFSFALGSHRTQHGFMVDLRGRNWIAWQKSPWPVTLSVYVDDHRGFYVNGQPVPREELPAKLSAELGKRATWDVYFEADGNCEYSDAIYSIDTIQGLGANLVWITPRLREELNKKAAP
jgi:biopolymer transport protein ExbD